MSAVLPLAPVFPVAPCGPGGPAGSEKQALKESAINAAIVSFVYFMMIPSMCGTGTTHVDVSNSPESISFWRK